MTARVAVLVSGTGSNLQAMIDARDEGMLDADLALVVSNVPGARALDRAAAAGIKTITLDHKGFSNRAAFDRALDLLLRTDQIDLVVLAGFMRLLTPPFVAGWRGRLVNIHPSLLPAFPGAHAIRDALAAKARTTGVTVHFVDEGTDTGAIIVQAAVDVHADDTEQMLAARLHTKEHDLYPRVVDALSRGLIRLEGTTVLKPP